MSGPSQQLRPWEELPNPHGLLPLSEQVMQIHPPILGNAPGAPKHRRRTTLLGRDSFGIGFGVGDLLISSMGGEAEIVRVEEIVLDGMDGKPHLSGPTLLLEQRSGQLFQFYITYKSHDRQELELTPLDMGWLGTHLGLIEVDWTRVGYQVHQLPANFTAVGLQNFKIKAKKLEDSKSKTVSLTQDRLTAYGQLPTDPELMGYYLAARPMPLFPDQAFTIPL